MNPYYLMALLFLALAVLATLDSSLTTLNVLPSFNGLLWFRVHVITLGALAELIFGFAPSLAANLNDRPRPKIRWNQWFALNGGLLLLLVGLPIVNAALITAGGTLVFIAVTLLIIQLVRSVQEESRAKGWKSTLGFLVTASSLKFYIAGLVYLLVGVLVGTGLWQGWEKVLRIVSPKEVHVHTNLWGFTAMIFAGILVDLYPEITNRSLAWPKSITPIFLLMVHGALGMVLGPWLEINFLTVLGLVLHTLGTIWLLLNLIKPILKASEAWTPGMWHLITAYVWFLLPVVVAPLVVASTSAGAQVAGSGGPILIFGWILQFAYAVLPYLFIRSFFTSRPARLGGSWFSLTTIHLGSIIYWLTLFFQAGQSPVRGVAFLLWILSLGPILIDLFELVGARFEQVRMV